MENYLQKSAWPGRKYVYHIFLILFLVFQVHVMLGKSYQDLTSKVVSGVVTDESDNPLPGATVLEKGTTNGTITNASGEYSLNVSEGAVLVISFVGYEKVEIPVSGRSTINVALLPELSTLNEVVVVGYGTQKKANLTGAVGSVDADIIENRPITSASVALQGTVPGVFVNQNSGQPGRDDVQIRIRGIGTLNNAAPLVLVDGIEAPIDNINPDDIASITVLKDAASAAIYGSRAANGVVLVTTKKGRNQEKPTFNYNGYLGVSEAARLPNMVTNSLQFATLRNEAATNFGNPEVFTQEALDYFRANGPNTDWFDVIFDPAMIQQHNFSVSGGNDKTNYRLSVGLLDQDGVTPRSGFNRLNTRLNLGTKVNDKFSISTGLSIVRGDRYSSQENLADPTSELWDAAEATPTFPPYDDMGRLAIANPEISGPSLGNPLAAVYGEEFDEISYDFLGNLSLEYEPVEGLSLSLQGAANYQNADQQTFNPSYFVYDFITGEEFARNALRGRRRTYRQSLNTTLILRGTYEKNIGNHSFKVLLGYSRENFNGSRFGASRNGFLSNTVRVLDVGDPTSATNFENATTWGLESYFGRINYAWDDKYLFEANTRVDGTSRFANDKWGIFPSFSAGWIISREDFFPSSRTVDFLKIRASWGKLGNQIADPNDDFIYARQLSLNQTYNFGGRVVSGVAQTTLGNPNLTWETTTVSDIGLDIGLWNSNLTLTGDYFIRTAKDILFSIPVSPLSGFDNIIANTAQVENKGWEIGLTFEKTFGDFNVFLNGNASHVTSEILQLNPNVEVGLEDRFVYGVDGRRVSQRGSPINAFYGVEVAGIFQSQDEIDQAPDHSGLNPNFGPGDLRFVDQNSDGVINEKDRTIIGKEDPTWLFGSTINLGYKNFDFLAVISGAADFNSYASEEIARPFFGNASLEERWLNRWTPENTDTDIPRIFFTDGPATSINNSFWILDRSYVRLKNVQIGYSLPAKVLDKSFISRLRIYANASNLLTFTKFPYFDPERPAGRDRGQEGFPNLKIISGGLNLTF